jgi:hypothetical protein
MVGAAKSRLWQGLPVSASLVIRLGLNVSFIFALRALAPEGTAMIAIRHGSPGAFMPG